MTNLKVKNLECPSCKGRKFGELVVKSAIFREHATGEMPSSAEEWHKKYEVILLQWCHECRTVLFV
jgi:hypothetical protein